MIRSDPVNTRTAFCHQSASLVMPNGNPRDWFFYPTLTLMIDSDYMQKRMGTNWHHKYKVFCYLHVFWFLEENKATNMFSKLRVLRARFSPVKFLPWGLHPLLPPATTGGVPQTPPLECIIYKMPQVLPWLSYLYPVLLYAFTENNGSNRELIQDGDHHCRAN